MPEPLTQEYLDTKLDEKFDKFADTVQRGFQDVQRQADERSAKIEQRLENIDGRLARVENTMVTISYLDAKVEELRGDHVALTRKEDAKLRCLVDLLRTRQVVSNDDANRILAMEPFPLPPLSR